MFGHQQRRLSKELKISFVFCRIENISQILPPKVATHIKNKYSFIMIQILDKSNQN